MATTDGFMRFFPYDTPYENQREAMDRIENALVRQQDVLFEGACGTGKTLSALLPALDFARQHDKTVVITTNVHQQMRQFVRDARAITRTEPIRAVVFRGKSSMCHIDVGYEECQVLRDNTHDLVDLERDIAELEARERELLQSAQAGDDDAPGGRAEVLEELESLEAQRTDLAERPTCDHYYRNLTTASDDFHSWLYADVRRPDEIYDQADAAGRCGYELLKDGMDGADLAVCNYAHLLHAPIREQFFRWLDRDPSEIITVFDEAHNIESAARESATRTLTGRTLESALDELDEQDDSRVETAFEVIVAFRDALVETYRSAVRDGAPPRVGGDPIGENWTDIPIANDAGQDDLTQAFLAAYDGTDVADDLADAIALGETLDAEYEEAYRDGAAARRQECQTLQAADFLEAWLSTAGDPAYYPVISVREDGLTDTLAGRAELYPCIPREVAGELFDEVYASVLMSATLRPFGVTRDVLGIEDPVELAYGLTFPEERRRTFVVDSPPLFARNRNDPEVQSVVSNALADTIRVTPGNTLVYFPSYAEAERYHDRLGDISAERFLDEPGTRAEELRESFTDSEHGALFTSIWGTLTEGVSFDGDDARSVVVVGVPYPYLDDRMSAVREAYDAAYGENEADAGWRYAVEIPTIRKTRQALGRVLRSPADFGARVLIDRRYTRDATIEMGKYAVRETFPPEEREEMIDLQPDRLQYAMVNFYGDLGAYGGEPPSPDPEQ